MNITYADARYTTSLVEDKKEGFAGLELFRGMKDTNERVARVLFWDASGQFFIETFKGDLPLSVVETLISEAKSQIVR